MLYSQLQLAHPLTRSPRRSPLRLPTLKVPLQGIGCRPPPASHISLGLKTSYRMVLFKMLSKLVVYLSVSWLSRNEIIHISLPLSKCSINFTVYFILIRSYIHRIHPLSSLFERHIVVLYMFVFFKHWNICSTWHFCCCLGYRKLEEKEGIFRNNKEVRNRQIKERSRRGRESEWGSRNTS